MALAVGGVAVLIALLAVGFSLGDLVYGWPVLRGRPAPETAAEPDPTACGFAYRAIGVGLCLGLALAISAGLLGGSMWIGVAAVVAVAVASAGVRVWRTWKRRATAGQTDVGAAPAATSAACGLSPVATPEDGWLNMVLGPRRAVTRLDHGVVLALVLATLVFFLGAELRTTQLYDPDGVDHAVCVRWLIDYGELREPFPDRPVLHYIDAYPPGYDLIAAALGAGLGGRAALPLKLLTALTIALAVGWLFGLVVELTGRPRLGLVAAFFFILMPNNLTAFIWSYALAFALFPLLTLTQMQLLRRGRWRAAVASALVLGGICLVAAEPGLKALPWAAAPVALAAMRRQWRGARNLLVAGCLAGAVALIWWGPMFARYGSYQQLWRAQLAPVVVPTVDAQQWTAPSLTDSAGSGDTAISFAVNFWGWDHIGLGSESPTVPLSLGWAQSILALFGLGVVIGQHISRRRSAVRAAGIGAADLVMGMLLLYSVFGLLGPMHGVSLYAYRFVLFLVVPNAYFAARGWVACRTLPPRMAVAGLGLLAVALGGSLFGYGVGRMYAGYWLGLLTMLTLVAWPVAGLALGLRAGAGVPDSGAAREHAGWRRGPARVLSGALILFALYAGGVNRYWVNYTMKVPHEYVDAVGRTGERAVLDRLGDWLPLGSMVYPAGGMALHRFVIAQEMRAPIFAGLDDAELDRLLQRDPAAFVQTLRQAGVGYFLLGPSYKFKLKIAPGEKSEQTQARLTALQQALDGVAGLRRVVTEPSPNKTMADTVLYALPATN